MECILCSQYQTIVANKTAYYSFYLPVALAMHMAGYKVHDDFKLFSSQTLNVQKYL